MIGPSEHRIEFQIRTKSIHEIAEWGIASHWKYKEQMELDEKDEVKFRWLRQFMEWQRDVSDPAEYLDIVKLDLFANDVYVFTPKGDIREFPRGSSPIDFAFSVHTDVGLHCNGARVNGRIVPLGYKLRSGDTIEIMTRTDQHPSKDWLKLAVTSRARSKIRQFVKGRQRAKAENIGREILAREFSKFGADLSKELKSKAMIDYIKKEEFGSDEGLMSDLGYGKLTARQVVTAILPAEKLSQTVEKKKGSTLAQIFKSAVQRNRGIVHVQGYDDILVSIAKCCSPIPGDSITGFVTRGRGVTVHRTDCARALAMDPARRIEVAWEDNSEHSSPAKIRILCVDKPGLLAEISKEISSRKVNIANAQCRSIGDQKALNTFEVGVRNVRDLNRLIRSLEKLKGVISVERVIS